METWKSLRDMSKIKEKNITSSYRTIETVVALIYRYLGACPGVIHSCLILYTKNLYSLSIFNKKHIFAIFIKYI